MAKMTEIEKQAKAAKKRLATYIDKLANKALAETAKDFEAAREKLQIK